MGACPGDGLGIRQLEKQQLVLGAVADVFSGRKIPGLARSDYVEYLVSRNRWDLRIPRIYTLKRQRRGDFTRQFSLVDSGYGNPQDIPVK